jgi:hypothetical protein
MNKLNLKEKEGPCPHCGRNHGDLYVYDPLTDACRIRVMK